MTMFVLPSDDDDVSDVLVNGSAQLVETLRARNPRAFFILWATDMAEHEIQQEAGKVAAQLQSKGDPRVAFIPVEGLAMTGCHWHPSVADHDAIDERHLAP